jgi:5-methylcytosine-specific restriction endonuclease McrA
MMGCPECDQEFETECGMKIHHKMSHGESIAGMEIECDMCGEQFRRKQSHADRTEKAFCSPGCQADWRSENYTGENNPSWSGGGISTECAVCGTELNVMRAKYQKYDRHFCSNACSAEWVSKNQSESDHPNWKPSVTFKCSNCGTQVERYPRDERYDNHFCSSDCLSEHRSKHYSADGRDRGKRGVYWENQRAKAIERDNFECQRCGLTDKEHRAEQNIGLHVHHKNAAKTFESDKKAHELSNLITLCSRCHRLAEPICPQ